MKHGLWVEEGAHQASDTYRIRISRHNGRFLALVEEGIKRPFPSPHISGQGRTDHTGETEAEYSASPYGLQKYGKWPPP